MFEPNKAAAMGALRDFLPRAGREYAATRNYDLGPERRQNVSMLSPWVRLRMLPEWMIVRDVLQQHSESAASKFIDEVCWRTYWKGWLQQHPGVWDDYLEELETIRQSHHDHIGHKQALAGRTGIDCFDAWTRELVETGYLHNHARMWYASIWIHTLKLPWVLGAAFFLQHLLDGDPASNTLSWRWVAGLHTRGKSYLARASNIERYTEGRFKPTATLADQPLALEAGRAPADKVPIAEPPPLPDSGRLGLLVHEEDLSAPEWLGAAAAPVAVCGLFPEAAYRAHGIAAPVADFRRQCMASALPAAAPVFADIEPVVEWAAGQQLDALVMAEPPVGFWNPILPELRGRLAARGIALHAARHWWDAHFFPQAGAGFFKLKKSIPAALERL